MSLLAIAGLPLLITGAALVGLPVFLHLIMRQEPRRLPFPAFRFLKQKRQINQRKIRLRHLLLLLLRMALIALICLSLWQPTVLSDGLSLGGKGRPVAAVVVLDTSPSMGYVLAADRTGLTDARQRGLKLLGEPAEGPWTCLDEARARILELLDDLPPGSKVAILDTADRAEPAWLAGLPEARQRVKDIKRPRGNSQPVTRALEGAYALLARADAELEPGQDQLPRLLAVFSDRTVPSWDVGRVAELTSFRDRVPPPSVFHVYVDVGVDRPVNTAITTVEMKPQIIPANQPVVITVVIEQTGGSTDNLLRWAIDGEEVGNGVPVNPGPDRPITRQLVRTGLKPGLHQARIFLNTPDSLPFDNERFVTFRVRKPRHVLALVDLPAASFATGGLGVPGAADAMAGEWKRVLEAVGRYACDVRPVTDWEKVDWNRYEQVTLLDVTAPPPGLWDQLEKYLAGGGHLIVTPPRGEPGKPLTGYDTEKARAILPKPYAEWAVPTPWVTWTWNALSTQRPLLSVFRQYKEQQPEFFDPPTPRTYGFWKVEQPAGPERVVVAYNDAPEDPTQRSPAILEWSAAGRGRVIQFTVPMGLTSGEIRGRGRVHNYATSWFYMVLANEAVRTLVGDTEDQVFNFATGQTVSVKWPAGEAKAGAGYFLSGPDVSAGDAVVRREAGQAYFRLGPEKTGAAGFFTLTAEDGKWADGFSLNVPAEESNLERVPPESIHELFGADAVFPADKKLPLADILGGKFTQPIELFPFLMILLLLILAVENWMGNKFYRKRRAGG